MSESAGENSQRRIAMRRSYALISDDAIEVKQARAGLVVPLVQALLAGGAVWLIANYLDRLPIWVLLLLLLLTLFMGPAAILGLVYNLVGASFLMERAKESARWQQGFLGLGLGTHELVPFWGIARIEVSGDFEDELGSGDLQDVVTWTVRLVKDNDRSLDVADVAAARPMAGEALDRANELASALAAMAGSAAELGELPAWALEEPPQERPGGDHPSSEDAADEASTDGPVSRRRYRRIDEPAVEREAARSDDVTPPEPELDQALRLMRDARTIAVVGASSDPRRPSNDVARYLIDAGYTVYFVNPNEHEIFEQPVYARVEDLPEPVDIVDVFRRSEHVPPVVDDAIASGASAVWMQLAITHEAAAAQARAAGLEVVMDRCTKIEHRRLRALGVAAVVDGD